MNRKKRVTGFTVVELLIVVVVVGILATLVGAAYNGMRQRSEAVALVDGLKKVEKGLRLAMIDGGTGNWWPDSQFGSSPKVDDLIQDGSVRLKNYLQRVPLVAGQTIASWLYDNDGDTYDLTASPCSGGTFGVNIYIHDITKEVVQEADKIIDDGNTLCGRVRWDTTYTRMIYKISGTQTVQL